MLKWPRSRRRKGHRPQRCTGRFSFSGFLQASETFVFEKLEGKTSRISFWEWEDLASLSPRRCIFSQVKCNQSAFLSANLSRKQKLWQSQWFTAAQRLIPVVNAWLSGTMSHFYYLATSERTFLRGVFFPLCTICEELSCAAEASS